MKKFEIYRAIAILYFLLAALVSFTPAQFLRQINVREFAITVIAILYFVCYGLLISIFTFYKEPAWKKIAIIFFIVGNIFFNLYFFGSTPGNEAKNFILLIFYVPVVIAFVTIRNKAISPLAQSFAYIMLIICLLRITLPYARSKANISSYVYFINVIFLMPSVFMIALYHKMISVSADILSDEEVKNENDLL